MTRAIFLDIDGVLNDHKTWPCGCGRILSRQVRCLNMILKACPDAKIVLTSAWRYSFRDWYAIEALLCSHGVDCRGRILGRTEFDPAMDSIPQWTERAAWQRLGLMWRKNQILEFLKRHPDIDRYVALDDLPIDLCHLVHVDGERGLRARDVKRAITMLGVL